jgi:hypothetical protein
MMARPAEMASIGAGPAGTVTPAITAAAAIAVVATAEAAEMVAEAATDALPGQLLIDLERTSLDSFQSEPRISLELLENSAFAFASGAALLYRKAPHYRWARRFR